MKGKTYQFQIPISILNYRDTVKVGDTIKVLVSYNPKAVINIVNNKPEDLSNFKFTPSYVIMDLLTVRLDSFYKSILDFKFKISGIAKYEYTETENSAWILQYEQNKINGIVQDTILLIPTKSGVFQFVYDATNNVYRGQTFPGKCPRTTYKLFPVYDQKISNERLTQFVKYAKITIENNGMLNMNPEFFSFGFCVKER